MRVSDLAGKVAELFAGIGPADLLVKNAGGVRGQVGKPLDEVTDAEWWAVLDANLATTFLCIRAVATAMKKSEHERIVNVISGAARGISLTGIRAYAGAKENLVSRSKADPGSRSRRERTLP